MRKRIPEIMEPYLRSYSVDVSPYSVRVQSGLGPQRQLALDEILRAEESPWGGALFLRTANRYRYLVIPRSLDGFDQLKDELRALGIPFERKVIPTNWEEFALALLFCATIACAFLTQNRPILIANLIVAILVGIGGFLIAGANPDNTRRARLAGLAAFLPAVFCALTLFL